MKDVTFGRILNNEVAVKLQTCSKLVAQQKREKNRTKPQNSWVEKLTKPEGDCVKSAKSTAAHVEDCSIGVLSDSWRECVGSWAPESESSAAGWGVG